MKKSIIVVGLLALILGAFVGAIFLGPAMSPTPPPPALPPLPIDITYRESLVGEGYVAVFTNPTRKHFRIVVSMVNPTTGETKRGALDIAPLQIRELGWAEDWKFMSGDRLTVSLAGHQTLSAHIP
jgi:hypothetical protein